MELRDVYASPVPTQTTFAFDGATAIAPMDKLSWLSKTASNVVPLFVVLKTPPIQGAT
jgi:hypothetical protein